MLPQVNGTTMKSAWEETRPADSPNLLIVTINTSSLLLKMKQVMRGSTCLCITTRHCITYLNGYIHTEKTKLSSSHTGLEIVHNPLWQLPVASRKYVFPQPVGEWLLEIADSCEVTTRFKIFTLKVHIFHLLFFVGLFTVFLLLSE